MRQSEPAGTTERSETFITALMTVSPPGPTSQPYFTERMSKGSFALMRTRPRPDAASCAKSVPCEPGRPPTLAAEGCGPDAGVVDGPGSGTRLRPPLIDSPLICLAR